MTRGPYLGLNPYSIDDAEYFFGRDQESRTLEANLRSSRLTLLYGPTGVGKTSLITAGLMSNIRSAARRNVERRDGKPGFLAVLFRTWQMDPDRGISDAIRQQAAEILPPNAMEALNAGISLDSTLERWRKMEIGDLLLVFDQFELFFVHHPNATDHPFSETLSRCIADNGLSVDVLISIREDWLPALDAFKGKIPALFNNYLRVKPLGREGAIAAIRGPLDRHNKKHSLSVAIEDGLVDAVLAKSRLISAISAPAAESFAAPALQVILQRLWNEERPDSNVLRLRTLNKLTKRRDIIDQYTRDVMRRLHFLDRGTASILVDRLVTPAGTKIAQTLGSLAASAHRSPARVQAVIDRMAPLLTDVAPPRGSQDRCYEISHDVLAPALARWQAGRKQLRKLGIATAVFTPILCLLGALYFNAQQQATTEVLRRLITESALVSGKNPADLDLSLLLAIEAMRQRPSPEAEQALRNAAGILAIPVARIDHETAVSEVAFAPDGKSLITRSGRIVTIAEVPTGRIIQRLAHKAAVNSFALSKDGQLLATASADGKGQVWRLSSSSNAPISVVSHADAVNAVAFAPGGTLLATASDDRTVRTWDPKTGHEIGRPLRHSACVFDVAFSPDGKLLVSIGDDGGARVWDLRSRSQTATLRHSTPLATSNWRRGLRNRRVQPSAYRVPVNALALFETRRFRPGPSLTVAATVGEDGTRLWLLPEGRPLGKLVPGSASAVKLNEIFVAIDERLVRWGLEGMEQSSLLISDRAPGMVRANFIPPIAALATAGDDGTARLWVNEYIPNLHLHEISRAIHLDAVTSMDFTNPEDEASTYLATGSRDMTARLWRLRQFGFGLKLHTAGPAAVSTDGKRVVWTAADGIMVASAPYEGMPNYLPWSWSTSGDQDPEKVHREVAIAIDADGGSIVAASGRSVRLWPAGQWQRPVDLTLDGKAEWVAFAGSDVLVATAKWVQIWTDMKKAPVFATATPVGGRLSSVDYIRTFLIAVVGNRIYFRDRSRPSEWNLVPGGEAPQGWTVSSNSALLALCAGGRQLTLFDLSTGTVHRFGTLPSPCRSVAFDHRGKTIAVGMQTGIAQLDLRSEAISIVRQGGPAIVSAAFSADDKRLAAQDAAKSIYIWDTDRNELLIQIQHSSLFDRLAFSSDGRYLLTRGRDDYDVDVLSLSPGDLIREACQLVTRGLTAAEQRTFLRGMRWSQPCEVRAIVADRTSHR
jgi:WD40 repeat protein